jgi:hypothetical protein
MRRQRTCSRPARGPRSVPPGLPCLRRITRPTVGGGASRRPARSVTVRGRRASTPPAGAAAGVHRNTESDAPTEPRRRPGGLQAAGWRRGGAGFRVDRRDPNADETRGGRVPGRPSGPTRPRRDPGRPSGPTRPRRDPGRPSGPARPERGGRAQPPAGVDPGPGRNSAQAKRHSLRVEVPSSSCSRGRPRAAQAGRHTRDF